MTLSPLTPITHLHICHNVPLDNSYKDTILFGNKAAQYTYFSGKAKYTLSNLSPIRLQNKIRIGIVADNLYDCNYLCFQNANFKNKWFYAFITGIDFINLHESHITYEIDIMQTWAFDYTLKPSFVLREHVNDDSVGKNIEAEPFDIVDYTCNYNTISGTIARQYSVAIYYLKDGDGVTAGGFEGKLYSGLRSSVIPIDFDNLSGTTAIVNAMIEDHMNTGQLVGNDPDNIVAVQIVPENFCGNNSSLNGSYEQGRYKYWNPAGINTLAGYTPKNKKLLNYPYRFVTVYTGTDSCDYKFEQFSNNSPTFKIVGNNSPNPEVICYPMNYKGISENINEKVTISNFPVCSWSSDMFKAWLAQTASGAGVAALATGIAALALPNPITIGAFAGTIAKTGADMYSHSIMSASAHNGNGGNALYTEGTLEFHYAVITITAEQAEKFDSFLNMYGYAVNKVKTPNRTGRSSWNYVQTQNCKAVGSVPFDDMARIREVYNNGVTFWHGDYVGDYNRSNTIV